MDKSTPFAVPWCLEAFQPSLHLGALAALQDFADAGANMYTFHLEAVAPLEELTSAGEAGVPAVHELIQKVKAAGMHAGLTVRPATPVELFFPYLQQLDMVSDGRADGRV